MRLLVGAGGTGGHIIPAIAIALEMFARNWDIAFIGNSNSMEQDIVLKNNYRFYPIHVQKIYRKLTFEHLKFPFHFFKSVSDSILHIKKFKPDVVICTGGFVSGPVAVAAIILGKTLYFQDGNSYPGLTTRIMAKHAKHVFIASDAAKPYLKSASCIMTGNPLLKFTKIDKSNIDWNSFNLSANTKKLFIIGGSQGSAMINNTVASIIEELLKLQIEVIWQTGKSHKQSIVERFGNHKGVHIFDFTDKMSQYYQMSDMAISRAGALSIAELEEHRIPTIFIPLPIAAENHQYKNAIAQSEKGLGLVIEQKCLDSRVLLDSIVTLSNNLQVYKDRLKQLPENTATQEISNVIEQEAKRL